MKKVRQPMEEGSQEAVTVKLGGVNQMEGKKKASLDAGSRMRKEE